jgi:hypothetical protein
MLLEVRLRFRDHSDEPMTRTAPESGGTSADYDISQPVPD